MLNRTDGTLVGTLDTLDHLVDLQSIALRVSSTESTTAGRSWERFSKIGNLHIFDLALLINELEVVLVDLKHEAGIFVAVVLHELHRVNAVLGSVESEE